MALYLDSSGPDSKDFGESAQAGPFGPEDPEAWESFAVDWDIPGTTDYWIALGWSVAANVRLRYDILAGTNRYYDDNYDWDEVFPATHAKSSNSGATFSLYVTYTAAGGETHQMAGVVASASALTGAINLEKSIAGAIASVSALSGGVNLKKTFSGTVAGISTLSGATNLNKTLAGVVASVSAITGVIQQTLSIGGQVVSVSTLSGAVELTARLAGTIAGVSNVSGSVNLLKALAGAIDAISALLGTLTLEGAGRFEVIELLGSLTKISTTLGALSKTATVDGALTKIVELTGQLRD